MLGRKTPQDGGGRLLSNRNENAENYTSTFDSTYSFPYAICEYACGDRESGRNR